MHYVLKLWHIFRRHLVQIPAFLVRCSRMIHLTQQGFGSAKRTRDEFIQSTKNSIPLTDFSADLLTIPKKITDLNIKDIRHILICIDNKSKFCFYAFLRNKGSFEVLNAFKQVLHQINKWRKKCIFYLEVNSFSIYKVECFN